jgi:hypothetical protein
LPAQAAPRCRFEGRVTSGIVPLPGVSIVVHEGGALKAATSTDVDGRYAVIVTPNTAYHVSADLTGFVDAGREIAAAAAPCDRTLDFTLALQPRTSPMASSPATPQTAPRFQTLNMQTDVSGAAAIAADIAPSQEAEDVTRLLPPGFSLQHTQTDAIAIAGRSDATNFDRGVLNDRMQAIALGQLDPATGQFTQGYGPQEGAGRGALGGFGPQGFQGFPGGFFGGRGGFMLGGRGARGQRPFQGSITYTFGGSALSSPPFQLRPDAPVTQPQFAQNSFGATFGGPLKIKGLYSDANRRTNFQINFTGGESNNPFDQYATVPTSAMRTGDFSASSIALIDPVTGLPFAGNQIPAGRIDPSAASLLPFILAPNLSGTTENYHVSTTAHSASQAVSLRLTQNLSPTAPQEGGRGAPGGRRGPGGGRGTNIVLSGQLQYRRNETQGLNVFPGLGGDTTTNSVTAPITLTVARNRSVHLFTVNATHATIQTTNAFSNTENVAGLAGIQYPASAPIDPVNWGVPNLSFSGFTGVRGASASLQTDNRLTAGYAWLHPTAHHRLRMGGDARLDTTESEINSNARGSFTFTGLYSSGGAQRLRGTGADFADFLLGLPQQASLQVGGTSRMREHAMDLFVEDNWQKSAKLTINLGLRYELALPYVEVNGRMANLDANPDISAVAPVLPGASDRSPGHFRRVC